MLDRWQEIVQVLWRRKLRTALTALAVAWGIFMLVVLLAVGRGLANGAQADFAQDALNSVWVAPGRVSRAYQGTGRGSWVRLMNQDEQASRRSIAIVDRLSARLGLGRNPVAHGSRRGDFDVAGVLPDNQIIEKNEIVAGRFINELDQSQRRKVAVIGVQVRRVLFAADEPVEGAMVQIGPNQYTVVGVIDEEQDEIEQRAVYVPLSTAQLVRGAGDHIDSYLFTVGQASVAETDAAVADVRRLLAARHHFDPADQQAVRLWNNQELFERFRSMFRGIDAFVWIIGVGTVLAAMVGVGNIMMISVHERTREIGLRKAVGAPPWSIVAMIVEEAVLITMVSGYVGLLAAVSLVSYARAAIPPTSLFRNPELDLRAPVVATAVLVVAGALAGLFPALRAARVNPIVALRVE